MRAVIYHHTDKTTLEEEAENQINELKEFCKIRGFDLINVYNEKTEQDGRKRPLFLKMINEAHKNKFDIIIVWSFNNFRRFSGIRDVKYINDLLKKGIFFVSYREPFLDTLSRNSQIIMQFLDWIASEEEKTIKDRTKAGLERARKQGKKLGRPKIKIDAQKVLDLRKEGKTLFEIASILGTSKETIRRTILAAENGAK